LQAEGETPVTVQGEHDVYVFQGHLNGQVVLATLLCQYVKVKTKAVPRYHPATGGLLGVKIAQ
jgi:hypothetical protein